MLSAHLQLGSPYDRRVLILGGDFQINVDYLAC